jgi:UMF1 family MFS transporter
MLKFQSKPLPKNHPKMLNAWCSYDIANSAYNLIITTVFFPIYYSQVTQTAFKGDFVKFFGIEIKATVLYDYAIASAYLFVAFFSPILSGIGDYYGIRKRFMQFFTYIGASACFLLYWFNGSNIEFGIVLVALAVVGYAGSLLFYNSFLPQIATPDFHDKVSARGFAWGYGGSVILLIFNLFSISNYQAFGFAGKLEAVRFSFIEVGLWWFFISMIPFYFLRDYPNNNPPTFRVVLAGFKELNLVLQHLKVQTQMKRFLLGFFFYSMGVQTIMLVATLFGSNELKISSDKLIMVILILQIVAILGATFFGWISSIRGSKLSITIMLVMWICICVSAYYVQNATQFYFVAAAVGLIMGGIQSQSRSAYSKLIPEDTQNNASFFSFYDITEKLAIVLGMFSYGFIEQITGNMRNSSLAMSGFFFLGLLFILRLDKKQFMTK